LDAGIMPHHTAIIPNAPRKHSAVRPRRGKIKKAASVARGKTPAAITRNE